MSSRRWNPSTPRYDADGRSLGYGPNVADIGPAPQQYAAKDAHTASMFVLGKERGGVWSSDTDPVRGSTIFYQVG